MLKNYLKTTLRNFRRAPGHTVINLLGLAVGIACCLLIALYIQDERSYDQYHTKADRIYRIVPDYTTNGNTRKEGSTQGILAPTLKTEFPEVEEAIRFLGSGGVLGSGTHQFIENNLMVVDAAVFDVFDFELIQGNPDEVLSAPGSIVLTEALASKYFGDADPVGQVLNFNSDQQLTVKGVVKAPPEQSHFTFDALISIGTIDNETAPTWMFKEWMSTFVQTYVLLKDEVPAEAFEAKMADLMERVAGDNMRASDQWIDLYLEALPEIYLTSTRDGLGTRGSATNLGLFSFVAVFILLLACINFTNLSTARAIQRAREVGVRKTIGAGRSQLVSQFIGEAIVMTILAGLLAIGFLIIVMPQFNELAGKSLSLQPFLEPAYLASFAGLIAVVGILAGSYPAFVLSGFDPAAVLKSTSVSAGGRSLLRRGLVVFQFSISIALMIATAVVYYQLQFMKNQDLGFEKEQVLVASFGGDQDVRQQLDVIKGAFARLEGIVSVSASQTVPGWGLPQAGGSVRLPDGESQRVSAGMYMVDYDYLDLYEMKTVAGRGFSTSFASDSTLAYLVNETAVKQLGLPAPEDAIGLDISLWGNEGRIVGVVKDFHHYALQTRVSPLAMRVDLNNTSVFSMRLTTSDLPATISALEATWAEWVPNRPFDYAFLDDLFDAQYRSEERFGKVFQLFAGLAILIACLGLFGLASYSVQRRTKEIGIRKVMGASTSSVLLLISREFSALVLLSVFIASPIMYGVMNRWLEAFPYRIDIMWYVFAGAGAVALCIAWATISTHAVRAALANPVKSLRYE